jgi:hypothetical protein
MKIPLKKGISKNKINKIHIFYYEFQTQRALSKLKQR